MEKKKIEVKDSRMYSLVQLYDELTGFFERATVGISEKDAHNRLNTKANHVAWLAGSLVEERFALAKEMGVDIKHEVNELFKDHKGIQDGATYPSLEEYKKQWNEVSPKLREALVNADEKWLNESFEMMPGEKMTHYELVYFTIYRESSIIGQIALWRRLLGLEAMKYM